MSLAGQSPRFLKPVPTLSGLLEVCCAAAAVGTIGGFFGQYGWILDLMAHFRIQYLAALLVFIPVPAFRRKPIPVLACVVLALVNAAAVAPLYRSGGLRAPGPADFRILLFNLNTDNRRHDEVLAYLQETDADVIVVEEIDNRWRARLDAVTNTYPFCVTVPRDDNFGIGLFSKLPIESSRVLDIGSIGVPSILCTLDLGRTNVCLLATHPVPPGSAEYASWRNRQLAAVPAFLQGHGEVRILVGDLNTTPWSYYFKKLVKDTGLRDTALGWGVRPTWPTMNPLLRIPIDHCLISQGITVVEREVGPDLGSDHYPLIVGLCLPAGDSAP